MELGGGDTAVTLLGWYREVTPWWHCWDGVAVVTPQWHQRLGGDTVVAELERGRGVTL